jgi:hypothetical protein
MSCRAVIINAEEETVAYEDYIAVFRVILIFTVYVMKTILEATSLCQVFFRRLKPPSRVALYHSIVPIAVAAQSDSPRLY